MYAGIVLPKSWSKEKHASDGINSKSGRSGSFIGAICSRDKDTSLGTLQFISKARKHESLVSFSKT